MARRDDYPTIKERAKREKAEIYRDDETGIQNDAYRAKGRRLYHVKNYSKHDRIAYAS